MYFIDKLISCGKAKAIDSEKAKTIDSDRKTKLLILTIDRPIDIRRIFFCRRCCVLETSSLSTQTSSFMSALQRVVRHLVLDQMPAD